MGCFLLLRFLLGKIRSRQSSASPSTSFAGIPMCGRPPSPPFANSPWLQVSQITRDFPWSLAESTAVPIAGSGHAIGGHRPCASGAKGLSPSRVHLYPFCGSPASVLCIPYLGSHTQRRSPPPTPETRPCPPSLLCGCTTGM